MIVQYAQKIGLNFICAPVLDADRFTNRSGRETGAPKGRSTGTYVISGPVVSLRATKLTYEVTQEDCQQYKVRRYLKHRYLRHVLGVTNGGKRKDRFKQRIAPRIAAQQMIPSGEHEDDLRHVADK